jgi:hypothetical protein
MVARVVDVGISVAVLSLAASMALASPSARGQGFSARDRRFYWYGIGAGIAITVCELERSGEVRKGFARQFISEARGNPAIRKQPQTVEALIDAFQSKNCKGL